MSAPIRVAVADDHFLIVCGKRAASIKQRYVAEMEGVPDPKALKMGAVRRLAPLIMENPARFGGQWESCEELLDSDRKCAMELYGIDTQGCAVLLDRRTARFQCPRCGNQFYGTAFRPDGSVQYRHCNTTFCGWAGPDSQCMQYDAFDPTKAQGDGYTGTEYGDDGDEWRKDGERGG